MKILFLEQDPGTQRLDFTISEMVFFFCGFPLHFAIYKDLASTVNSHLHGKLNAVLSFYTKLLNPIEHMRQYSLSDFFFF